MIYDLILYLKKSYCSEEQFGYFIQKPSDRPLGKRKKRKFRWMQKIPIPFSNVLVEVNQNNGLIYIFNNDKPMGEPLNIGTLVKNHLFRNSKKLYW